MKKDKKIKLEIDYNSDAFLGWDLFSNLLKKAFSTGKEGHKEISKFIDITITKYER